MVPRAAEGRPQPRSAPPVGIAGLPGVSRLKRIRYGTVELPQPLLRGQSQELSDEKVDGAAPRTEARGRPAAGADAAAGDRPAQGCQVDRARRRRGRSSATATSAATAPPTKAASCVASTTCARIAAAAVRQQEAARRPDRQRRSRGEAVAQAVQAERTATSGRAAAGVPEGNPAAFRTWYVPEGVDTGPSGHRNADGRAAAQALRQARRRRAAARGRGRGGRRQHRSGSAIAASGCRAAVRGQGERRGPGRADPVKVRGSAVRVPTAIPATRRTFRPTTPIRAPSILSDRPRGPRPPGNRPPGNRPAGNRPAGPRGPRPGGNRGPRGGGPNNGNR